MNNTLTEPSMRTNVKKIKQLKTRQNRRKELIETLRKILINEVQSMPDELLWEEIELARLFWGKNAMKNLETKIQSKDIQSVMDRVNIDEIMDRAKAELKKKEEKKKKGKV